MSSYRANRLKILYIDHFTLDQLKYNPNRYSITVIFYTRWKSKILRLSLLLLFCHALPDFLRRKIEPLKLACGPLAHGSLESPELSICLQLLDSMYRLE